jgi:hypothetical protein
MRGQALVLALAQRRLSVSPSMMGWWYSSPGGNQVRRTDWQQQLLVLRPAPGALELVAVQVLVLGPNGITRLDRKLQQEQVLRRTCFPSAVQMVVQGCC